MRLWSINPKYLDARGLVALWAESLLAQKVLTGKTKAFKDHPQLVRFRNHSNPLAAIGLYLYHVYEEGKRRGYKFRKEKILVIDKETPSIVVSLGQILFEFRHLMKKLKSREPQRYKKFLRAKEIEPNPIFRIVKGDIELWERRN